MYDTNKTLNIVCERDIIAPKSSENLNDSQNPTKAGREAAPMGHQRHFVITIDFAAARFCQV